MNRHIRSVSLATDGGDRATAYPMSEKILSTPEGVLCTWINADRQNCFALLSRGAGEVIRTGLIGEARIDNHCGASLAHGADGTIHAVLGGHHSPLDHYLIDDLEKGSWRHVASIHSEATYPSLTCAPDGLLHLTFREQRSPRWGLAACRFDGSTWSPPRVLVTAAKPGYVFWTNSIAADRRGRLHLTFANVRPIPAGGLCYGASYLFSDDAGRTWQSDSQSEQTEPTADSLEVYDLPLIDPRSGSGSCVEREYLDTHGAPGPHNREYLQMVLSNVVIDNTGGVHVVYHDGISGTAALLSKVDGGWKARNLTERAIEGFPGYRIHMQSTLSVDRDGNLYAGLMLQPGSEPVWGARGTRVALLRIAPGDAEIRRLLVDEPDTADTADTTYAQWLPVLERQSIDPVDHEPHLLCTLGTNAGGFDANTNDIETDVRFAHCTFGLRVT